MIQLLLFPRKKLRVGDFVLIKTVSGNKLAILTGMEHEEHPFFPYQFKLVNSNHLFYTKMENMYFFES